MKKTIHLVLLVFVSLMVFLSACTPTPTLQLPSVPPTFTPEPTATVTSVSSNTPLPTATFTPISTPNESLHLFGTVWTMVHGQFHPVAGATVGISSCFPLSFDFHGESDRQGHFDVFVPSPELNCGITGIRVTMSGYIPQYFTENVADLRTIKSYDIVLALEATATPR